MASNFPTSPTLNQTYSADNKTWVWNGSAWGLSLVAGTLPVTSGGTGQTSYTNGQLLIGNTTGNTLTKATLTQGSGITITNGAGAITIAASAPTPAGSTTQVQYNSAGALAGSANLVFDGTTLTANDLIDSSLTASKPVFTNASKNLVSTGTLGTDQGGTGLTSFTSGGAVYASSTSALTTGVLPVASGGTGTASPGLVQGTNVTISGTWPNQTISASGGSSVSAATPSALGTVYAYKDDTYRSLGLGENALSNITPSGAGDQQGGYNTAIGAYAFNQLTSGSHNTGIGFQTGYLNTTGRRNTYLGYQAGRYNVSSVDNVAVGYQAGYQNTSTQNVSIGSEAGAGNTTGNSNIYLGYKAGYTNSRSSNNTYLGSQAAQYATGSANTIVGASAATGTSFSGSSNTLVGVNAGGSNLSSGGSNTFIGNGAGSGTTTGSNNTFVGKDSGANSSITGSYNVILGSWNGYDGIRDIRTTNKNVCISNGNGEAIVTWQADRVGMFWGPMLEKVFKTAAAATGTINFDANGSDYPGQSILWYSNNATGNWTINVRATSSSTISNAMPSNYGNGVGSSLTIVFMATNGSTAYYPTGFQVDGTAKTVKWQGGTAPSSGNANSVDMYVYTIIKDSAGSIDHVFGSQTRYA